MCEGDVRASSPTRYRRSGPRGRASRWAFGPWPWRSPRTPGDRDELRPLLYDWKREPEPRRTKGNMNSRPYPLPSPSFAPSTSVDGARTFLPHVLNGLSFLAALTGLAVYAVFVALGDYVRWGTPLLASAVVCRLLSVHEGGHYLSRKSSGGRPAGSRGAMLTTFYHRAVGRWHRLLARSPLLQKLGASHRRLRRALDNDSRYNLFVPSFLLVVLPCSIYFFGKVAGHLRDFKEAGEGINHKKLANDFGKLGSAALSFLLIPTSKHSPLTGAMGWSEVHALRLHITAGCVVLFGGIAHGVYHAYNWLAVKGYGWNDIFPGKECYRGLIHREYDKDCHELLVNLLGILCGLVLLVLGASSLYWVRRNYYRTFYVLHVTVSIALLFGLVMHYNKMIWYLAPSAVYYLGCNLPVHLESLGKYWRQGGIRVERATCVPDSGGCVELTLRMNHESDHIVDGDRGNALDELRACIDTVGAYVQLLVPEISTQSHPFTVFSHPNINPGCVRILFRPRGNNFTASLSKRLRDLTLFPEPTPSEIENHSSTFSNHGTTPSREASCPEMLANGVRHGTTDMLDRALRHDRVVIFAGGAGLASYLSLIHALASLAASRAADAVDKSEEDDYGDRVIDNHRRTLSEDGIGVEGGLDLGDDEEDEADGRHSDPSSPLDAKRIDVHWMSRDEGLIRHAVRNYLVPSRRRDSLVTIGCGRPPWLVNVVIHHTSPHSSSEAQPQDDVENGSIDGPTTWERSRRRAAAGDDDIDGGDGDSSYALPLSAFQGRGALACNALPAVALAVSAYAGAKVVEYCFDEVQSKRVIETRVIAVLGIIASSTAAALVVNAAAVAVAAMQRVAFRYSKLGRSESGDLSDSAGIEVGIAVAAEDESDDAEVGCDPVPNGTEVSDDGDESNRLPSAGVSRDRGCEDAFLRITHRHGRPNLSAIVRDIALMKGGRGDHGVMTDDRDNADVGIFMCGPGAMTNAVWDAIEKEEGRADLRCRLRAMGTSVSVYQEVFEL
ncbi:hypothetical protein ACHAWF_011648 [Thalassiosira exigua]